MRVVVNVTTDKCYENREWEWGYREDEPMGGHDPYRRPRAAPELVTSAYRRSFFADRQAPRLASARAGNVIGGGDWGEDRLVPDIMRAALAGEPRAHPQPAARSGPGSTCSTRCSGYLVLAAGARGTAEHADGWNFGPVDRRRAAGGLDRRAARRAAGPSELRWDARRRPAPARGAATCSSTPRKARARLGWAPRWGLDEALDAASSNWYTALRGGRGHARSHAGADRRARERAAPLASSAADDAPRRLPLLRRAARARLRRPRHVAAGELLPHRRAARTRWSRSIPLRALVCEQCFLVQLEEFETPEQIFTDYAYFSSYSTSWLEHAAATPRR